MEICDRKEAPWKSIVERIASGVDFLAVVGRRRRHLGLVLVHLAHQLEPLSEKIGATFFILNQSFLLKITSTMQIKFLTAALGPTTWRDSNS
jgi:hypothetical protein